jgi:hypothetical protein
MPVGIEEYFDCTIHWDTSTSPDANLWRARAAVVCLSGSFGSPNHAITGDRFKSEEEARNYVLRRAKEWVDERLGGLERAGKV